MFLQKATREFATKLQPIADELSVQEARALFCHYMKISKTELILNSSQLVPEDVLQTLEEAVQRRLQGEPLAKIIGEKEFWSLSFRVNHHTLDPRPDSEVLIEALLEQVKDKSEPKRILDFGTGSGCLLLSLLHELPYATGLGVDCSSQALLVAKENAERLGFKDRVSLHLSDWGEGLDEKFDIIVSNPPYISQAEYATLKTKTLQYDPVQALVSGDTGLEAYEKISKKLHKHLAKDGIFAIEIGINQKNSVLNILKEYNFIILAIQKDLAGIPRCIVGSHS